MQRKNMRYSDQQRQDRNRRLQIRNWTIVILVVVSIVGGIQLLRNIGSRIEVTATRLPCTADQHVTVFGNDVLYYDNTYLHCMNTAGSIRWSYAIGAGATFSASDTHIVAWNGSQLYIIDHNGHPTYNEKMAAPVQFARIGSHYCAAVIGTEDTKPEVLIKNMDGTHVDSEIDAFAGKMLLDMGFYGDYDQYLWTLSLDVYGMAINTVLNTFQVNKMNAGIVNLGEHLAYKVLYESGRLRVFTTQQMYTYDYKGVQDVSRTQLVHGWQLIAHADNQRNGANMLLAPTAQLVSSRMTISELRVLTDSLDRRYTLPDNCVGASIDNQYIYAFSPNYLYRTVVSNQHFDSFPLHLPDGRYASSVVGLTKNHRAIVLCNDQVFALSLPQ